MSRLNLSNLETVCCIARVGTFSAAAERLNASQPTVTGRVRELEQSLGIQFFRKRGRNMELTEEGRQFIERVEPIVAQLEQAVSTHADTASARGTLRLGIGIVTMTWFGDVLAQLRRDMPLVQYDIDTDLSMNMLHKLESGKLDLAVVAGRIEHPVLATVTLASEELRWIMGAPVGALRDASMHATSATDDIVARLDSRPLWFVSRPSDFFPRSLDTLKQRGATRLSVNTCSNMIGMLQMIEHTGGIGLVALALARPLLQSGRVIDLSAGLPSECYDLTLVYRTDERQSMIGRVVDRIVERDAQRRQSRMA
ncbi:LysR family transcriptional regulator [Paraburkholderia fynbosensis]|uniref:HTH-type transcriptional regulator HdfR n=1 Tax=Paraburkholderia fynbosensis TaxID=1200993 RepID=A0A6J5H1X0_9BURK|nr:LysR family transcriptional regulator [Paraburkholderia fynbosensis]CAB3810935.1 HTH-type transcriptional regulator HdfR [Paraburkholderia fynbosensis]